MIIKWPKHRTHIGRTMRLAMLRPYVNKIIADGLEEHKGTTGILEDIITYQDNQLKECADVLAEWRERGVDIQAAERRGGVAAMRLMVHHGTLHNRRQQIEYGTHYIQSQAQVPDQPLDSETVKVLDLKDIA